MRRWSTRRTAGRTADYRLGIPISFRFWHLLQLCGKEIFPSSPLQHSQITKMAADTVTRSAASMDVEEDLTDEQMQALLDQAADRLRQGNSLQAFEDEEDKQYKFPRLDVGEIAQSYVKPHKGVVQMEKVDRNYENQRKTSNQIRKVEDPVAVRNRAAEVCYLCSFTLPMRKTYPNYHLSRVRAPSWLLFCTTESFIFIVTLRHTSINELDEKSYCN